MARLNVCQYKRKPCHQLQPEFAAGITISMLSEVGRLNFGQVKSAFARITKARPD